jgi:hypothetical protein
VNAHELKAKTVLIKRLEAEASVLSSEVKTKQRRLSDLQAAIAKEKAALDAAQTKTITMSEHAMLRLIQRRHGVDLQELAQTVITDKLRASVATLGDGKHPIEGGGRAVIRDNVIVTIED